MNKTFSMLASGAAAALVAVTLAAPAQAERGDKHFDNPRHDSWHGHHRGCPPGLIASHGRCYAPRRDAHRERHHRHRDYRYISDYHRYHLPPPPRGQRYALYNNHVVRVNNDTLAIVATVGLLSVLLNSH
ncbi:RcnB family protein [Acidimangrovimonas sediminis]|uniref:RcnB family protein n=1 Tax=Acidimangrovimonas sediminis TaxID=2056283 RepID=UPI001304992F|nr:RcnB family protein [Acidimangrovimonas sediminis]